LVKTSIWPAVLSKGKQLPRIKSYKIQKKRDNKQFINLLYASLHSVKEQEQFFAVILAGDSDKGWAQTSAHIIALVSRFE
jgi:hypothetical protein